MKRKVYAFQRQCDEKPVLYRAAQDTWYACMVLLSWYCRVQDYRLLRAVGLMLGDINQSILLPQLLARVQSYNSWHLCIHLHCSLKACTSKWPAPVRGQPSQAKCLQNANASMRAKAQTLSRGRLSHVFPCMSISGCAAVWDLDCSKAVLP